MPFRFKMILCKMCRISPLKLDTISNKIRPNVLIMRKKFLNRLQNGYKLVYLMYMNDLNLLETERRTVP